MHRLLTGMLALPLLGQTGWLLPPPPDTHPLVVAPRPGFDPGVWNRKHFLPLQRAVPGSPGSVMFLTPPVSPRRIVLVPTAVEPSGRPCAVPLVNMLLPGSSGPRIPTVRPPAGGFHMRDVQVPAPSCEDTKTR